MCGFVGSFTRGKRTARPVEELIRCLAHRGPDDEGFYHSPGQRAHLAFRRLAIIDLETGEQPVRNEDGTVAVILNGEIYNYVELTAELKAAGHTFRSHGDAEVIAHLYEEHGDDLLKKLQGMFAFILWDEKRQRMLIARDHAGIKPLYYAATADDIVFASEVKSVLRMPGVSREIDPAGLTQFLRYGFTLAPTTIFRDIRKLPAGHKLVIEDGRATESIYWELPHEQRSFNRVDDVREQVLASFDESIRLHLRSDVAVGAFLSGGIDSGLIVARAAHLHPRLKTYTLRFEGGAQDESGLAALVAERYGTDHTTFTVPRDGMQALIPRIMWACDEPLGDSGLLPNYVISELSRKDGVKVVLNGAGGDELFAGYTYFFRSGVEEKLRKFGVPAGPVASLIERFHPAAGEKFRRAARYDTDPVGHYLGHVTVWGDRELAELLGEWHRPAVADPRREAAASFRGDQLNARMYADIRTYLTDDLMLLLDRMTMIHSLEGRVPFLHRPLLELAMSIPGEIKAPGGERKGLLRSIAAEWLPSELIHQPKRGFNSPVGEWMRGDFGDRVVELLLEERSLARPWWRGDSFRDFVKSPAARGRSFHRLFLLFVLEVFFRVHLDGQYDDAASVPELGSL